MTNLLQLNKLILHILLFFILVFFSSLSYSAEDIWKKEKKEQIEIMQDNELGIKSSIPLENISVKKLLINEEKIESFDQKLIGIIDPKKNNFSLDMWV